MTSVAFVSHGGGPLPVLGDEQHRELVDSLQALTQELPDKPSVIVVVSAHWETKGFEITAAARPGLFFDYYGFPEESYELQYAAPGAPDLAREIATGMQALGIPIRLDEHRGYDHGVFIPLMLMYPEANIPVLQLSLDQAWTLEEHWQLGQQLSQVLPQDALLVGSGFSFHNMSVFFRPKTPAMLHEIQAFQTWLDETVTSSQMTLAESKARWLDWESAEGGRFCHPQEEHLLPLLVCHAAAKGAGKSFSFNVLGIQARHFIWS